jgi:hypothetical protein
MVPKRKASSSSVAVIPLIDPNNQLPFAGEVGLLKERGLTAEAVVADFVFKNIQPLKDRAYPAYLYRGLADSTRVTNRRIPAVDLVSRLEMILKGKVPNVGAPVAYSA